MFEYFSFLSGMKHINVGGLELNPLLLVALGAGLAVVVVYSLMRMSK
jgi:hypothetical protein